MASPAGALGAAEIAFLGVGVAGLAAFGIEHPIHDRTPFVAAAALLGLLLTAGEGLLPDGRVATPGGKGAKKRTGSARMAAPPASTDMACYIVDGVQTETGDLVVCTPQPQEFAWFHGIELGQLREIEDTESYLSDESVACEREVSYNGEEEWYCR